jgi:hypothetical protein
MYRQRMHFCPNSQAAMMELVSLGEQYNKFAADKGWAQGTFWSPVAGESEIIAEFDYPDLATYQQETEAMFMEPEMMALAGKIWGIESFRSPYSELLGTMPSFA